MKTLTKPEFLILLKNVINVLESENIKYDIPYVHIDKDTYNYINILIIENVNIYELSHMFHLDQITEKYNIVYTKYNGFAINFIRTNYEDWGYVFNYYCWNVLHILINAMIKPYNLEYSNRCLNYVHGNKKILLTKNLKEIFELFDLKFNTIALGFPTDFTIFSYIENSSYCDKKSFSLKIFKELDPMFEYNKKYYQDFLDHCPSIKCEINLDEHIEYLNELFPNSKLIERIAQIELKKINPNIKFTNKEKKISAEEKLENLIKSKEAEVNKAKDKRKINIKNLFPKKKEEKIPKQIDKNNYEIEL